MASVILIYGSTTGNTQALAESVAAGLEAGGADATVKDVADAGVEELAEYDAVVLGSSTWGDGELQDDFAAFYQALEGISLAGKKAAVFGPGDQDGYPDSFCAAVDIIEQRLRACGAEIVADSLKLDGDVEPHSDTAEAWGAKIAGVL